ncbi:MAG: hypothetical protein ACLGQX_05350 [Acidobacteriota bacterium]
MNLHVTNVTVISLQTELNQAKHRRAELEGVAAREAASYFSLRSPYQGPAAMHLQRAEAD